MLSAILVLGLWDSSAGAQQGNGETPQERAAQKSAQEVQQQQEQGQSQQ